MAQIIQLQTCRRNFNLLIHGWLAMILLLLSPVMLSLFIFGTVLVIRSLPHPDEKSLMLCLMGLGFLFWMVVELMTARNMLFTPGAIRIGDDDLVTFKFLFWSSRVSAADITGLRKVPYRKPTTAYSQDWYIYVDYLHQGKPRFIRFDATALPDFMALFSELRALNSAITYTISEREERGGVDF